MAKVSQSTPVKDIVINQGEDYRFQLKIYTGTSSSKTIQNITGYSFVCKVREEAESTDALLTATCNILDAVNGTVEVFFSAEASDGLELDGTKYSELTEYTYDVFMTDTSGNETRILCGSAYISPSVSNR